ncbi:Putative transposase (identified by ISEscan HMM) [Acinetobacter baumannii]|nr:Putative transposase (identified by ISEscan HMM) [Acinetobacter baumannii]
MCVVNGSVISVTLDSASVPPVIDKGIASPELLSHVLVSKYADHLPYRQRLMIYQRARSVQIHFI